MKAMRVAAIQMTSGLDPAANIAAAEAEIRRAHEAGAWLIVTPEMTTLLDRRRPRFLDRLGEWPEERMTAPFRALAAQLGVTLVIGSIPVLDDEGERAFNRSIVFGPDGREVARYDKIHLFDVDLGAGESYRESGLFRRGRQAVMAETPAGRLGLTVCYDLRFPLLHRALAMAGAEILIVPAAFTRPTGRAHWHVLLRARAIETGCFVIAAAQSGRHEDGRETYGHSMIVSPWGEVLGERIDEPGALVVEIDMAAVADARRRIPALDHGREFVVVVKEAVGAPGS